MERAFTERLLKIDETNGGTAGQDPVRTHELRSLFDTFLPDATDREFQDILSIQDDVHVIHARLVRLLQQKIITNREYVDAVNAEANWSMRRCAKVLGRRRCQKLFGSDALDESSLVIAKSGTRTRTTTKKKSTAPGQPSYTATLHVKESRSPYSYATRMTPSARLAEIVGSTPMPRQEVTKRLWAYIKKHNLQDARNKRMIRTDAALKAVFGGKSSVNMLEMTKLVSKHLK